MLASCFWKIRQTPCSQKQNSKQPVLYGKSITYWKHTATATTTTTTTHRHPADHIQLYITSRETSGNQQWRFDSPVQTDCQHDQVGCIGRRCFYESLGPQLQKCSHSAVVFVRNPTAVDGSVRLWIERVYPFITCLILSLVAYINLNVCSRVSQQL